MQLQCSEEIISKWIKWPRGKYHFMYVYATVLLSKLISTFPSAEYILCSHSWHYFASSWVLNALLCRSSDMLYFPPTGHCLHVLSCLPSFSFCKYLSYSLSNSPFLSFLFFQKQTEYKLQLLYISKQRVTHSYRAKYDNWLSHTWI